MLECEVLALLYSCNGFQLVLLFPAGRLQKMSEDASAERQPQEITLTRAKWTPLAALSVSSHTKSLSMSYGHVVKQAN